MVKKNSTKADATESRDMPATRRLELALHAAWQIEAMALKLRETLGEADFEDHMVEIIASTLLDRVIVVSQALMDVAQPGEATVAEMERSLGTYPPLTREAQRA